MDDFRFNRISTGWLDGASFFQTLLFPSHAEERFRALCGTLVERHRSKGFAGTRGQWG